MVKYMMVNGIIIKCMDLEKVNNLMETIMRDNGQIIKEMDKENLLGLMVILIMENGKIIKDVERDYLIVKKADMKEIGLMIKDMAMALFNMILVINILGNGLKIENKVFYIHSGNGQLNY